VTRDLTVWLAVGVLALVCLGLVATVVLTRRASVRDLRRAHAELGDLRARVDELESLPAGPPIVGQRPMEYLITGLGSLGSELDEPASPPIDRAVFADTVLRETVVKAASLAHGVRRGLAPATRNRIRFEMRQEVRRSRKQRRADLKAAQRDLHARQRAGLMEDAS
jgi:heme exporter protein D